MLELRAQAVGQELLLQAGPALLSGLLRFSPPWQAPPGPLLWQAAPSRFRRGLARETERWVRMGSITENELEPSTELLPGLP